LIASEENTAVDQTANPYCQPTESEEDAATRYPPKLADALARMKARPCLRISVHRDRPFR
jgi:hypothetical protein